MGSVKPYYKDITIHTIGDIIRGRPFLSFTADTPLHDIIRDMYETGSGAAILSGANDEALAGFLTDREIIYRLACDAGGGNTARLRAYDVMIARPEALDESTDIDTALQRITALGFHYMPVTRNGMPCGIVSEREVFLHAHERAQQELRSRDTLLSYFMFHEPYGQGFNVAP